MTIMHINEDGTLLWLVDNIRHRIDGPAVIYANGDQYWYANGMKHRIDGPAVIYPEDNEYFWNVNGFCFTDAKDFQKAANLSDEDMSFLLLKYNF